MWVQCCSQWIWCSVILEEYHFHCLSFCLWKEVFIPEKFENTHRSDLIQEAWIEGQPIPIIWQFIVVAVCSCVAQVLQTDYGAGGILLIYLVWMTHENVPAQAVSFAVIAILFFGVVELPGVIAFLPILLYNGKKGPSAKYIFYAFYPVHLFLLHLIQASTFFIVR